MQSATKPISATPWTKPQRFPKYLLYCVAVFKLHLLITFKSFQKLPSKRIPLKTTTPWQMRKWQKTTFMRSLHGWRWTICRPTRILKRPRPTSSATSLPWPSSVSRDTSSSTIKTRWKCHWYSTTDCMPSIQSQTFSTFIRPLEARQLYFREARSLIGLEGKSMTPRLGGHVLPSKETVKSIKRKLLVCLFFTYLFSWYPKISRTLTPPLTLPP